MRIDLHCHSTVSDGSLSPAELVQLAARLHIACIALTDHDTLAGYHEAEQTGKMHNVQVICGLEISAYDKSSGRKVHILGYAIQDAERVEQACAPYLASRHEASVAMVERIAKAGYPLSLDDVLRHTGPQGTLYRQHIMHALMAMGYETRVYGPLYQTLFGKNGIAVIPSSYMDAQDAVALIANAGGQAFLAHPYLYDSMALLPPLVDAGLVGIEAYHPSDSEKQTNALLDYAIEKHLEISGGSDFHGMYGERPNLLGTLGSMPKSLALTVTSSHCD